MSARVHKEDMDTTRHIEDTIEIEDIAFGEGYVDLQVTFELTSERGHFHFYEGLEFKAVISGTDEDVTDELSEETKKSPEAPRLLPHNED